jgi:hypothetical protein
MESVLLFTTAAGTKAKQLLRLARIAAPELCHP